MADRNYLFDRVVRLRFVSTTDGVEANASKYTEICFDPTSNRELCPRIDFWVQGKGMEFDGLNDFFKTARIDLYNIGTSLNDVLSVYQTVEQDTGAWNIGKAKVFVSLEVGHVGQGVVTIFKGTVGSYNVERRQTETTVDNVWHLFCQAFIEDSSEKIGEDKAYTTDNFLEPGYITYSDAPITGEEAIKRQIFDRFLDNMAVFREDGTSDVKTISVNESNFKEYFDIKYSTSKKGDVPDYNLEYAWKNNKTVTPQDIKKDWRIGVQDVAKKWGNCKALIYVDEDLGKTIINIYKPGRFSTESSGKNWVIHNFENLLTPPMVTASTLEFNMIMEPSMRTADTIELASPDAGFDKTLSFEFNFNQGIKGVQTAFAGSQVIGLPEIGKRTKDVNDIKSHGNIFNRQYSVIFIEHQGSTHQDVWSTKAYCAGVRVNDGETRGV